MEELGVSGTIAILRKLQDMDSKLAHMARMKEFEPKRLAESRGRVADTEADLESLSEKHSKRHHEVSLKELDIKSRVEKVERHKAQLLAAASNKEYQALLKEISLEEMEKKRCEEELLEMMIDIEEFSARESALKTAIAKAKEDLARVTADVEAALSKIQLEEKAVVEERSQVAVKLDSGTLRRYEGLFKSRAGEAVVAASYETGTGTREGRYLCRGCFMPLTHQMVNLLLIGREIVTCKSCGRLLYVEENPEEAE